jgi:hypothetical protein
VMDGLRREEQHLARSDDHLAVPDSFRNQTDLTLPEAKSLLIRPLDIRTKEDVDGPLEQVQHLVLIGMHFPLVAYAGRLDGQKADVTTIELDRK